MDWTQVTINNRHRVSLLLASSPHPLTDRLVLKYRDKRLLGYSARYILKSQYSHYIPRRRQLALDSTTDEVDIRTAVTYALIYACWSADIELVLELIQNLREFIDINAKVHNGNVLNWTLKATAYWHDRKTETVNICRLLIVYYGSKLKIHLPESIIRKLSYNNKHADVIAYLVTVHGSEIDHARMADDIFRCLVSQDEAARSYLRSYKDYIREYLQNALVPSVLWGSTSMFDLVLDTFQKEITVDDIGRVFRVLCNKASTPDWDDKIAIVFEVWANQLTPGIIEAGLIDNWIMAKKKKPNTRDRLGHMAHTIIGRCMHLLQDQGIQIALALCCLYTSQNTKLLDLILDRNLEQIQANPRLARHALIECANHRDIDTFEHLLLRVGPCVCAYALEFWCEACDLEAVSMVLDVGAGNEELLDCLPAVLVSACATGDAEMVELLIRTARVSNYGPALLEACHNQHEDVIRVLADCDQYIDFSADTGVFTNEHVRWMDRDIVELVNTLFGTSIDSTGCPVVARTQFIRYDKAITMYPSYKV